MVAKRPSDDLGLHYNLICILNDNLLVPWVSEIITASLGRKHERPERRQNQVSEYCLPVTLGLALFPQLINPYFLGCKLLFSLISFDVCKQINLFSPITQAQPAMEQHEWDILWILLPSSCGSFLWVLMRATLHCLAHQQKYKSSSYEQKVFYFHHWGNLILIILKTVASVKEQNSTE